LKKLSSTALAALTCLLLTLVLAACGDTPATPAAVPAATTKNQSSYDQAAAILNGLSSLSQLNVPQEFKEVLRKNLPGGASSRLYTYGANDTLPKMMETLHTSMLGAGYKTVNGETESPDLGGFSATYTKTAAPDISVSLISTTVLTNILSDPDKRANFQLNADSSQKLLDQLKDKKYLLLALIGDNIAPKLDGPIDESLLPVYPGATRLAVSPGLVNGKTTVYYLTTATKDEVINWLKHYIVTDSRYNGTIGSVSPLAYEDLEVFTTRYTVRVRVIDPEGQKIYDEDDKEVINLTKPGPKDTLLIGTVTPEEPVPTPSS
jgi:hypothetical protein